jgi:radical SAM protein with 4Fe4S-binding SPASM domain
VNAGADRPLRLLFWESTSRCNLACRHCRRLDADAPSADDLTTDEFRGVLRSAASLARPIVVFSGGEPLLRDDWAELAGEARGLHLPTALATNGTLIDRPLAGEIAAAGFRRVSVSIDGADAATHDAFRGVKGAFARALAGIDALRSVGQEVQINATVAAHNIDQLDGLYELARSTGSAAMHLFLLVPVGCGLEIAPSHQLAPQRYEDALEWLADRQGGDIDVKATCAPHYHRLAAQRGMSLGRHAGRGCLCGLSVMFVSHRGEVFPCGYLPVRCGSVREGELAGIWRNSDVLAKLRDFDALGGKCGRCEYRGVCGGCRARAFAATGDYLAEEPCCSYEPRL